MFFALNDNYKDRKKKKKNCNLAFHFVSEIYNNPVNKDILKIS